MPESTSSDHLSTGYSDAPKKVDEVSQLSAFLPMDRRLALVRDLSLPDRTSGAALFADISGFTPLTEGLAAELGRKRGAEEVLRHLNPVFTGLIKVLYRYGGVVISFAGDAITCWFDENFMAASRQSLPAGKDSALRAVRCAYAIQEVMARFATAYTPDGNAFSLGIKVAVAAGPARRFLVGEREIQLIEVLAGETLNRMAAAEHHAAAGEIVVSAEIVDLLDDGVQVAEWRGDDPPGLRFALLAGLRVPVAERPWPPLDESALPADLLQAWLLPPVLQRLQLGQYFLGDLRQVAPLFLKFEGLDYDGDDGAGDKLDDYICWVQGVLERYGGSLIQLTLGDKGSFLYAAFGAPLAYEDIVDRALSAALELKNIPEYLGYIGRVQIGVAHGQVWTGACGSPQRHTFGAMGNWVNMAARLMAKAAPGQILVSQQAADMAGRRFRFRDLGLMELKGAAQPLQAFEALSVEVSETFYPEQFSTRLVGRSVELELLVALAQGVRGGQGALLFLEAEAGLGKSHLAAEVVREVQGQGFGVFLGAGQSIEQHTPYRAWRDLLTGLFQLEELPDRSSRASRVLELVQQLIPEHIERLPVLNDILELQLPENELTDALNARERNESLTGLLLALFQARARQSPLLLVLEDAHWLDALSWELALQLVRGLFVSQAPFLFLLVTRPQRQPAPPAAALARLPYSQRLQLAVLPPEAIKSLLADGLGVGEESLPVELVELIQQRAEGNPFFASELLVSLQERGAVVVEADPDSDNLRCRLVKSLPELMAALPDSLQEVILARIDRLPSAQQLALKIAAVIGRIFTYSPLSYLFEQYQVADLARELAGLERRELVLPEQIEPELTYIFKHIIIRDVAYDALLFEQRRPLHRLVAEWYEKAHEGEAADSPYLPLLVHHYHEAEAAEPEQHYARLAGEQAAARFANEDALIYFDRALELTSRDDRQEQYEILQEREKVLDLLGEREAQLADLAKLAVLAADATQRAAVALRKGGYYNATGDYSAAVSAAQQAIRQLEDGRTPARTEFLAKAYLSWAETLRFTADYRAAEERLETVVDLLQGGEDKRLLAAAVRQLGMNRFSRSDFDGAQEYYQQALAIYREIGDRPGAAATLNNLGVVARQQNHVERARSFFLDALAVHQTTGHLRWQAGTLRNLGQVAYAEKAYSQAADYFQQALDIQESIGDQQGKAQSFTDMGLISYEQGNLEEAGQHYTASLAISRDLGNRLEEAYTVLNIGAVNQLLGVYDLADKYCQQALTIGMEIGNLVIQSYALHNLGEIAELQGLYPAAGMQYRKALAVQQEIADQMAQAITLRQLGRVEWYQKRLSPAQGYLEKSYQFLQQLGLNQEANVVQGDLGLISLEEERLEQARVHFEAAASDVILQDGHTTTAFLAARALYYLKVEEPVLALDDIEPVLLELQTDPQPLEDLRPLWLYSIVVQVLRAANDSRAAVLIETAYELLMTLADSFEQAEQRRCFLENVPWHRQIIELHRP